MGVLLGVIRGINHWNVMDVYMGQLICCDVYASISEDDGIVIQ